MNVNHVKKAQPAVNHRSRGFEYIKPCTSLDVRDGHFLRQSASPAFPKLPPEQLLPLCKVSLGPLAFVPPRQPKEIVVMRGGHGPVILRQTFAEDRKSAPGVEIVGNDQDSTWCGCNWARHLAASAVSRSVESSWITHTLM